MSDGFNRAVRRARWAVGLCALALLSTCGRGHPAPEPVVTVQAAEARQGSIAAEVRSDAVVFPIERSMITPKITAPVRKFYVRPGEWVRKGQLLAVLENRDLKGAALEARGAYEQAQASLQAATGASIPELTGKAEADARAAKEALNAQQRLYDSRASLFQQGALPRKELDQAAVALAQAEAQFRIAEQRLRSVRNVLQAQDLKSAEAQLSAAKGKYLSAEALVGYTELHSPIDGFVTERPFYAGETPSPGTPLLTVMDISRVVAQAHVSPEEAARIHLGDAAQIVAPGVKQPFPGKVTLNNAATDPNSTTVAVWVEAANPHRVLRPGTTVRLKITTRVARNAVIIPSAALQAEPDGTTAVLVAGSDGRAHRRNVQVGIRTAKEVQILSGLGPGENVVTVGSYALEDNTRIQVSSRGDSVSSAASGQPSGQPHKD